MKLTKKQTEVVERIIAGENLIVTGGAGCGKTFAVNHAVKFLESIGRSVEVIDGVNRRGIFGVYRNKQHVIIANIQVSDLDGFTRIDFGGMD